VSGDGRREPSITRPCGGYDRCGRRERSGQGHATAISIRSYDGNSDVAEMSSDAAQLIASNHSYGYARGGMSMPPPFLV